MRIDKFLSNLWFGSRTIIWKNIKKYWVLVNWVETFDKEFKLKLWDKIYFFQEEIDFVEDIYVLLNKPKWYVSSSVDEAWYSSYMDLLDSCIYKDILKVVGRLDVDTTWFLLLSNSWDFIHSVINPKKEIYKKYKVISKNAFNDRDLYKLSSWVIIDENYNTKKAVVEKIWEKEIYLSICEWKFHQIKKMLEAVENKVLYLKRISIWTLELWDLELWEWRYLSDEEIKNLKELTINS